MDDTDPLYFCKDSFHFLPSDDTLLAELESVVSHKLKSTPEIQRNQSLWATEVVKVVDGLEKRLNKLGWTRVPFNPPHEYDRRLFELDMLPAFLRTGAKASTAGMYPEYLQMPVGSKKRDILDAYLDGNPDTHKFFDKVFEVWKWLKHEGNCNFPIHAYPKDEPVSYQKLKEGKHRVILMPDWSISILEKRMSQYYNSSTGEIAFLDDVLSLIRPFGPLNPEPPRTWGTMIGSHVVKELPLLQEHFDMNRTFDYDISKWDKSLPKVVTTAFYESYYGQATTELVAARNIALGICGKGTVLAPCGDINFGDVSNWCSGADKTLAGNDLIHEALCNAAGFGSRILMGDDANVEFNGTADELVAKLASFGLTAKYCEKIDALQFCKTTVADGRGRVDLDKIERKVRAHRGEDADVIMEVLRRVF